MRAKRRRAVVATPFPEEADRLCALLSALGYTETIRASDGLEALRCVAGMRPDALIADAVLPSLDGAALIGRIAEMPLNVVPAMVLLTVPGMTAAAGRTGGLCAVLERPVKEAELEAALDSMAPERRPVSDTTKKRAEAILESLGVPGHPGREYLLRAILIVRQDARFLNGLTTRLYPAVAETFGVNRRQVERAMSHVIDGAWRSGEMETQYRIFGDTIDARRGNPTCGEMIAQIADILRWEGNA